MSLKQKNIALLIGFLVLLFICFKMPISQTLNARSTYLKSKTDYESLSSIPTKIKKLAFENNYLDSIFNKYQFSSKTSFQSNLLHIITTFSDTHDLTIVNFEEPHTIIENNAKLLTFSFTCRGTFSDLLLLVHELEQLKKMGKILSVSYEKKKNYRTGKRYLEVQLLLQRIEK